MEYSFCEVNYLKDFLIRKYDNKDANEVLNLIHRNSLEINAKDYGLDFMQKFVKICDANWLSKRASFCHMYVAEENGSIVGVGGISSYFGSLTESIILNVFVMPEYHGMGIGKKIVQTLENDEYGIRANRIEVPASIAAKDFYHKLGYKFKDGIEELDEEKHYRMEKIKIKIELKQLNVNMAEQEYEMLQGILDIENGFTNPAYNLSYKKYKEWLQEVDNHSRCVSLPKEWIPYTTYILYIDNVPVGYGRVRHSSSEYLETVVGAGNLGYGISKEYRRKGYGDILFKELLKKCKEHGYNEIKLFPLKTNEATVKIMMKNGGRIIGDFKNKKHIILIPLQ